MVRDEVGSLCLKAMRFLMVTEMTQPTDRKTTEAEKLAKYPGPVKAKPEIACSRLVLPS